MPLSSSIWTCRETAGGVGRCGRKAPSDDLEYRRFSRGLCARRFSGTRNGADCPSLWRTTVTALLRWEMDAYTVAMLE